MLAAQVLPPPPAQLDKDLKINARAVSGLEGEEVHHPGSSSDLPPLFQALAEVTPSLKAFFASALEYAPRGGSEDHVLDLMCTYGTFLPDGAPRQPGDLVGGDGTWGLVAEGRDAVRLDRFRTRFELGAVPNGPYHWRPSRALVIEPGSPTGQFWGPGLWHYRSVLTHMQSGSYQTAAFMEEALSVTSLPLQHEALLVTIGPEVQLVDTVGRLRPGTILLDEDPKRVALVVTDTGLCRAAGTPDGPDFYLMSIQDSGCHWLWVPHIL